MSIFSEPPFNSSLSQNQADSMLRSSIPASSLTTALAKTERITARSGGSPVLSANGRYLAFEYAYGDLVPNDPDRGGGVFRFDLVTKQTKRVSASLNGDKNDADINLYYGGSPSISADGRYVAFTSGANNLVSNDLNGRIDVFVRDMLTDKTTLVSVGSDGRQINVFESSLKPAISANGQFVAFHSEANNLVLGDTNFARDVFVRDIKAGTTTRVSIASNGAQSKPWNFVARADSQNPSISSDGRFIAFESNAINLDSRDTGSNFFDIFVHDRQTGTTRQVSVNSQGNVAAGTTNGGILSGDGNSQNPVISANGRYVVFQSGATNLVPNDTNDRIDTFRHDLITGETILISVGIGGNGANSNSAFGYGRNGAISSDGRYAVFESNASNLVPNDNNNAVDVFLRDIVAGTTERISVNSSSQEAVGGAPYTSSGYGTVSDDGRYVSFLSRSANLVEDQFAPFKYSVYLRDRASTTIPDLNNIAPKYLQIQGLQASYEANATLSLINGFVWDSNGWSDIASVDFWLTNEQGQRIELSDVNAFSSYDANFARFGYSTRLTSLGAGNYKFCGIAYDKAGAASNSIAQSFTILRPRN
jgi:Tol biopolymer transport system component